MKKTFSILVFILALSVASFAFGAAGSCTQELSYIWQDGYQSHRVLTYTCTFGTGANATDTLTLATTAAITSALQGWYLITAATYNNATAPTALYDVYLKETVGVVAAAVDILGTAGMNRPGTAGVSSQFTPITDTTYVTSGLRPALNTLTLSASGNAVESGSFVAQFIFGR
jgi:hypothetical protein